MARLNGKPCSTGITQSHSAMIIKLYHISSFKLPTETSESLPTYIENFNNEFGVLAQLDLESF